MASEALNKYIENVTTGGWITLSITAHLPE